MSKKQIYIAVEPRRFINYRQFLRTRCIFDENKRVLSLSDTSRQDFVCLTHDHQIPYNYSRAIPTTLRIDPEDPQAAEDTCGLVKCLRSFYPALNFDYALLVSIQENGNEPCGGNIVANVVSEWLSSRPPEIVASLPCSIFELRCCESWRYQHYRPLLLLSHSTFKSELWQTALAGPLKDHLPQLYESFGSWRGITHVAMNAPIPAKITVYSEDTDDVLVDNEASRENVLRSPTGLQPLLGFFGNPDDEPTEENFSTTLWAKTFQNGIYQFFAPLHTMFSPGNITEKARIIKFPGLRDGRHRGREVSAVDLYAGIGYFAFSYKKAGAATVFAWEINPWSVEGFRRGAEANKWDCIVMDPIETTEDYRGNPEWNDGGFTDLVTKRDTMPELIIFTESNQLAGRRIHQMREGYPPVRHVNCGYLPSSEASWETAVDCLDSQEGGWVHAHENVREDSIDARRAEVEVRFWELATTTAAALFTRVPRRVEVECEHVERVKSYAPGVIHCVFDIHIQWHQIPK